jgi:oligopeptide transport system substrate-binding protein
MKKLLLILLTGLDVVTRPAASETLPPIGSPTLDEATRNKVLLINEGAEPRTLDPQVARGIPEDHIIMGLIEGLVGSHPTDQSKEVPGMADRWVHNDDYSVWTFHIGKDRT